MATGPIAVQLDRTRSGHLGIPGAWEYDWKDKAESEVILKWKVDSICDPKMEKSNTQPVCFFFLEDGID